MKPALALFLTILASAAPARAQGDIDPATAKKRDYLAAKAGAVADEDDKSRQRNHKRWQWRLDRRVGRPPAPTINVFNGWTHEYLAVAADAKRLPAQDAVNQFMRCRYTNRTTNMDPRLFPALIAAARHFKAYRVVVISAHRSPKYNLVLQKKGRQVARRSKHVLGTALDFQLLGVSTKLLKEWAQGLAIGGVGYYPESGFIHIDTDRVRTWSGR